MNRDGERVLIKIPENTGLVLVHDYRSGGRLELVMPVLNEEKRILNLINYYKDFDIVLMDGGSTDRTIELAEQERVSVFRRTGPHCGENHFVFYANMVSKSGYSFYMMADEFIEANELLDASLKLAGITNCVINVKKIESIYGCAVRMKKVPPQYGMARGFCRGSAAYDPYDIHNSLHFRGESNVQAKMYIYDIHHLHVKSIKNEYGKMGLYLDIEVDQKIYKKLSFYKYVRRFLVPLLFFVLWRSWFNGLSLSRNLSRALELSTTLHLAAMCWLEQKYLPNIEIQNEIYAERYKKNKKIE